MSLSEYNPEVDPASPWRIGPFNQELGPSLEDRLGCHHYIHLHKHRDDHQDIHKDNHIHRETLGNNQDRIFNWPLLYFHTFSRLSLPLQISVVSSNHYNQSRYQ